MAEVAWSSEREGMVDESEPTVLAVVAEVGRVAILLADQCVPERGGAGLCLRILEYRMVRLAIAPVDEHTCSDSGQVAQYRGRHHLLTLPSEGVGQAPCRDLMSHRLIRILAVSGAGVWMLACKRLEYRLSTRGEDHDISGAGAGMWRAVLRYLDGRFAQQQMLRRSAMCGRFLEASDAIVEVHVMGRMQRFEEAAILRTILASVQRCFLLVCAALGAFRAALRGGRDGCYMRSIVRATRPGSAGPAGPPRRRTRRGSLRCR